MLNLANILTLSRLFVLPFMVALFFVEGDWDATAQWWCLGLYVFGAVTDFFDGWVARKFNQVTDFGTFLDPIVDKIYVGALLVLLVGFGRLDGLWMIPVVLIFTREFLISGMREFLGPKNVKVPVTKLAKWKTTSQMIALGFLIMAGAVPFALEIGQTLLLIATILTVITGWGYLRIGLGHMKN